jgi:integrase/recombinase XerD
MNQNQHIAPSLYAPGGARKYVNLSERAALLSQLASLPLKLRLFVLTFVWTGARISEALSITPQCFQLERCVVAIQTLKRRRFVVREIPIPPDFVTELDRCFDLRECQRDPERAAERLWKFHRVTGWRLIKSLMQSAGIHGIRATPRGLRHAFGVGALGAGVPLNTVQRLLGHSSIKTTTIYTEACGPDEQAIVARFWNYAAIGPRISGIGLNDAARPRSNWWKSRMFKWLKNRWARTKLVAGTLSTSNQA